MYELILITFGFLLEFLFKSLMKKSENPQTKRQYLRPLTHQQKLHLKSYHQTDSDRIRELNLLSASESVSLRLLKQTFVDFDIAIKQKRFIIIDQEDGLPLHLYKGLISSAELKQDYQNIISAYK